MSINYTTLFTQIGRCVAWANSLVSSQNSLFLASSTGEADNLLSQYENRRDLVGNFQQQVQNQASAMAGWVGRPLNIWTATLADLQDALNASDNGAATILPLLAADMAANTQTIKACTGIAATPTPGGSNVGNGKLVASVKNVAGATEQRIIPETVSLVCTSDQWSGGIAGSEIFSVTGLLPIDPNTYGTVGNGSGPSIRVMDSRSLLSNGDFETWTVTNTPDNWTLDAGAITTNVQQNTGGGEQHNGTASLALVGDGTTPTIELHQAAPGLRSSRIYAIGAWVRIKGTVNSGSTLTIAVKGTGFSTQNVVNLDPHTLTTSYQFFSLFVPTGTTVPSDLKLDIAWTSANSAGAAAVILIDDVAWVVPTQFGHVQYALFRGSSDFASGDTFSVTTANNQDGAFATAFARWFDAALPVSGSPSISDSLAV